MPQALILLHLMNDSCLNLFKVIARNNSVIPPLINQLFLPRINPEMIVALRIAVIAHLMVWTGMSRAFSRIGASLPILVKCFSVAQTSELQLILQFCILIEFTVITREFIEVEFGLSVSIMFNYPELIRLISIPMMCWHVEISILVTQTYVFFITNMFEICADFFRSINVVPLVQIRWVLLGWIDVKHLF